MRLSVKNLLLIVSFTVVAAFYYFLTWSSEVPILGGDHAVYLLMADHLSFFAGLNPEVTSVAMRYSPFPPFYPLLLALFGGTSAHVTVAHAITTTFLLAAVAVYFIWVRAETRSTSTAFLLSLVCALLPATLLQSLGILSENLYLLLTLLAIWLANKPDVSQRRLYSIAVVIGMAVITRTIGITMIAAFAVHLFLHKKDQRMRLILVSIAPLVFWNVLRWALHYEGGYLWLMADILKREPLENLLWEQLSIESHALWVGWITSLDHLPSLMTMIAGSVLGSVCIAGTLYRVYRKKLDGIYLLFYFCLLMLWPFSLEAKRFLFVIIPIAFFHGFEVIGYLLRRFSLRTVLVHAYSVAIALIAFPATGFIFHRVALAMHGADSAYANSADWYLVRDIDQARMKIQAKMVLVQSWKKISEVVPEHDCVYHVDPPSLMLYANRRSYPPPIAATKSAFLSMATYCRYFYVGSYTRIPYRQIFYPAKYIEGEGQTVFVYRLNDRQGTPILGMLIKMPKKGTSKDMQSDASGANWTKDG